jgi:hypothetical protein
MTRYPSDRLHEEVAYLAFHFHWSRQEVMQLSHQERQRWVVEVARINQRLNEAPAAGLSQAPAAGLSYREGMRR